MPNRLLRRLLTSLKPESGKVSSPADFLRLGEICPATIIKKAGIDLYLVEMHGRRFHVRSSLKFNTPDIFVQVRSLMPRVDLKILTDHLQYMERIIEIGTREELFLDSFCQWCLAVFLSAGYPFGRRSCGSDIEALRGLAQQLDRQHLIPLTAYAEILIRQPELFHALTELLFTDELDISLPDAPEADLSRPDEFLHSISSCYSSYRLDREGQGFKQQRAVLQAANSFLNPRFGLHAFLLPCRGNTALVKVACSTDTAPECIRRYQCTLAPAGDPVTVMLRIVDNQAGLTFSFLEPRLAAHLRALEQPIAAYAGHWNLVLLPVHYERSVPCPILTRGREL